MEQASLTLSQLHAEWAGAPAHWRLKESAN